ncbi:MAG: 5-(carboxyamino)imidazole ribonucleotide mutase [Myxococcota bacterium]|nr:5-(carboxyamino)imidazole ribonucleotide mutase [Myxococcota bacterium]
MTELPLVGIIMGSDSDLPVMRAAAETLDEFAVPCEMTVISAHRAPDRLFRYAREAAGRGLRVIIAGAGGAAHLPGVTAALTELPVIGVPVRTEALGGVDSLYSIVQMPPGVPVATVAINGARNAGLLAVQILGVANPALRRKMSEFKAGLRKLVEKKAAEMEREYPRPPRKHRGRGR